MGGLEWSGLNPNLVSALARLIKVNCVFFAKNIYIMSFRLSFGE